MHDRALEEIGERRQADVRVRADVVMGAGRHVERPEVVEEDEGPDRAAVGLRQQAPHDEAAAEVLGERRESLQLGHEGVPGGRSDPV